ncbi:TilS substrate C-terminal domain-containing protein [Oscillospiraceae bacterium]|nr:TilS substrate C-terminal domain-containing protein [Oscillospiraceae bacterium]
MGYDLSVPAAQVYAFGIREGLFTCKDIVVGLSGGPDSVMLLLMLSEIREAVGEDFPRLHAVHINHNIREEALKDQELSRKLASDLDVPFTVYSEDVLTISSEMKRSVEDTGRIVRYRAFRDYIAGKGLTDAYIAVAHHKDDVAETVMLNLFRGSGLEGLVSPVPKSDDVIRPLLCLRKREILSYLEKEDIAYATDITNSDSEYTRNAWRNKILPLIGEYSVKDPVEAVNDTYRLLKDDLMFLESEASSAYEKCRVTVKGHTFVKAQLPDGYPDAIRSRILRLLWKDTFSNLTDFSSRNTADCLEALSRKENTRLDMPFGRIFVKAGGYIAFCVEEDYLSVTLLIARLQGFVTAVEHTSCKIDIPKGKDKSKTTILPNSDIQIKCEIIENIKGLAYNNKSWFCPIFDGDETMDLVLCNGSLTHRFKRAGSDCSKPLGRLLMSLRVPKEARDFVMYVESRGEIIWIPGIGASQGIVSERAYEAWKKEIGGTQPAYFLKVSLVDGDGKEEYGSV